MFLHLVYLLILKVNILEVTEGENQLLEHFPNGKILRPSLLYGKGDNFFGQFSDMTKISPFLPVISRSTKFQPVFVEDVAKAIIKLIKDRKIKIIFMN